MSLTQSQRIVQLEGELHRSETTCKALIANSAKLEKHGLAAMQAVERMVQDNTKMIADMAERDQALLARNNTILDLQSTIRALEQANVDLLKDNKLLKTKNRELEDLRLLAGLSSEPDSSMMDF